MTGECAGGDPRHGASWGGAEPRHDPPRAGAGLNRRAPLVGAGGTRRGPERGARRRPTAGRAGAAADVCSSGVGARAARCAGARDRGAGTSTGAARTLPARPVGARAAGDGGSATVWSLAVIGVLCVVFGVVLALGQAVVVRHRAAGGADLAALAAADHWAEGEAVACARAEEAARAQRARLVRCSVAGEVSDVTAVSGRGLFTAEVRARAGPPAHLPAAGPRVQPHGLVDLGGSPQPPQPL